MEADDNPLLRVIETKPLDGKLLDSDVAWENLVFSDQRHLLSHFLASMCGLKSVPSMSFQLAEAEFRRRGFHTHLIAIERRVVDTGSELRDYFSQKSNQDILYECIASCRPKEVAMQELLSHSSSYAENFDKLGRSGWQSVESKDHVANNLNVKVFSDKTTLLMEQLKNNEGLLVEKRVPLSDLQEYPDYQLRLVGIGVNGAPIVNPYPSIDVIKLGV